MRLVTSTSNYLFRFSLERGVMHYRDSSNRLTKLISMTLRGILRLDTTSARDLASVVGQILSIAPVTRNLSQIVSRHFEMLIGASSRWDLFFTLDRYVNLSYQS